MSSRKFRIWEVTSYVSGNLTLIARFPFNKRKEAEELARNSLSGYVLPADASHPLINAEILHTGTPIAKPLPVSPPVPLPDPPPVPLAPTRAELWV